MTFLIVFLFKLNGEIANIYLGEVKSQAACVEQAREMIPKVLPEVKDGLILCVKKMEV